MKTASYMKPSELKKWRIEQFLSQRALAELLEVHQNTVLNWEKGHTAIPGTLPLALRDLADTRRKLVEEIRKKRKILAERRAMKMAKQHPEHYAEMVERMRKARLARRRPFNQQDAVVAL